MSRFSDLGISNVFFVGRAGSLFGLILAEVYVRSSGDFQMLRKLVRKMLRLLSDLSLRYDELISSFLEAISSILPISNSAADQVLSSLAHFIVILLSVIIGSHWGPEAGLY